MQGLFTASRYGSKSGYITSQSLNRLVDAGAHWAPFLVGSQFAQNPTSMVLPTPSSRQPLIKVASARNIKLQRFVEDDYSGVTYPAACTQHGYFLALLISRRHNRQMATTPRSSTGDLDLLHPLDLTGGHGLPLQATPRITLNLINSAPITQQQSALNCALFLWMAENSGNEIAEMANHMGATVGKKWDRLASATFGGPGFNSINSSTGLIHLFGDVAECAGSMLAQFLLQGKRSDQEVLEFVSKLGAAAELAKEAALGALSGTQVYIEHMDSELSIISGLRLEPARRFFTEPAVEGVITVRNEYVMQALDEQLRASASISSKSILEAFTYGSRNMTSDGSKVKQIAEETSTTLANESVKCVHHDISSIE